MTRGQQLKWPGGAEPITDASTLDDAKGARDPVVEHLTKPFAERVVFDDVPFEIGHGEAFGFHSPSEAGEDHNRASRWSRARDLSGNRGLPRSTDVRVAPSS